ncbi:MAG: hypothetical protein J5525_12465 [Lachnospiraceae bacterium]|nr:hypothetical protein [Lachnospiraceae bacterium]
MVKDNRPYTIENGHEDSKLITNEEYSVVMQVGEWIRKNIRPSDTVESSSSYSIKHTLEHDTGIYLTNNQFKDAMWLAGYKPEDENELNWHYRITVKAEPINPNPFLIWLESKYDPKVTKNSPKTDLCLDIMHDENNFPIFAFYPLMQRYLEDNGASHGALDALYELWKEYTKECENE